MVDLSRADPPAVSVRLAEQVAGDPGEVRAHGLDGGVRVACPEGGDDRPVVFLVKLPPLPGRAAALEVAPDLAVPADSTTPYSAASSGLCAAAMMPRCSARSQDSNSS